MIPERRIQERFALHPLAKVTARFTDTNTLDTIETEAENISAGGVFLRTRRPLTMAGKVTVEFLLAVDELRKLKFILSVEALRQLKGDRVWVKASGVVIRQEASGAAVIFDQNYQITPIRSGAS